MAYLVLENGKVFEGRRIGAGGNAFGELVFTTGMTSYTETLTDPSYAGQIIIQTFPLMGNYGICEEDFEGDCVARAYVVHELCDTPSNFRLQYKLDDFLKKNNIPGICGLDTRELTRTLREEGAMNAMLCDEVPSDLSVLKGNPCAGVVKAVTCKEKSFLPAEGKARFKVALMDFGAKRNIARSLSKRGCDVTILPAYTKASEILEGGYDGVMLSNGPGDPAENVEIIAEIKKLIGKIPVFGICLGHQLTALAMGGKTEKLKYGHRGANQPVKDMLGKRCFITSQNHGYAVISESLKGKAVESYANANDGSCEGLIYPGKNCFTVQFHPEACGGPKDTAFLFDEFLKMMKEAELDA